jgi:anti-sigma B factor antagonist
MKINLAEKYNSVVIELKGDLMGGEDAAKFKEKIYSIINQHKQNVVVDMSNVKFVNSSGLGILISGFTTLKNAGGELKLAALSDKIKGLLSITKLNQVFQVYPTVDAAIKSTGTPVTA